MVEDQFDYNKKIKPNRENFDYKGNAEDNYQDIKEVVNYILEKKSKKIKSHKDLIEVEEEELIYSNNKLSLADIFKARRLRGKVDNRSGSNHKNSFK